MIELHKVSVWNTVPALATMLTEAPMDNTFDSLQSIRLFLLSGDWIPLDLPEKIWTVNKI